MERQYVGIDLHRRRSTIVRMDEAGEVLSAVNLDNDPIAIALEVAKAGPDPEVAVAVEAIYGWYWLVDALQGAGANVRLAHSLGVRMYQHQRVKNDRRDAAHLADLLRIGTPARSMDRTARDARSYESWCVIAPSWSRCGPGCAARCMRSSRKRA